MRRNRRRESGVTVVEAAFAIPILFLFIFAMVDLGMWVFNSNQASNAARDGAREGILDFEQADVMGSGDYNAIVAAIQKKIARRTVGPSDVSVECVDPDNNVITCSNVLLDNDRIRVEVAWTWRLLTPIANLIGVTQGQAKGSATMVVLGRPLPGSPPPTTTSSTSTSTTTTDPSVTTTTGPSTTTTTIPPCVIPTLNISSAQAKNNGSLQNDLVVTFTTNGVADCNGLSVQLQAPFGGSASKVCPCGGGPTFSWTYGKNSNNFWTKGTGYVRVLKGSSVIANKSFSVT